MNASWQFEDQPNTASFTTIFVLDGAPILRVYHDYEGGWQFHGSWDDPSTTDVARLVSLASMIDRDASLAELYDLPLGWIAFRDTSESPWTRECNNPFPTYADDGYYLDDAIWLSEHRDDVNPSCEFVRDNLAIGTYVKLLFRFAAEDADRQDYETERMWVLITTVDEDGHYVGTLENDPRHNAVLRSGDIIHFHPSHVVEVLDEEGA